MNRKEGNFRLDIPDFFLRVPVMSMRLAEQISYEGLLEDLGALEYYITRSGRGETSLAITRRNVVQRIGKDIGCLHILAISSNVPDDDKEVENTRLITQIVTESNSDIIGITLQKKNIGSKISNDIYDYSNLEQVLLEKGFVQASPVHESIALPHFPTHVYISSTSGLCMPDLGYKGNVHF